MKSITNMKPFRRPDWRWVGISYCLFVVFHLLPLLMLITMYRSGMGIGWNAGTIVWLFFGLAIVGAYAGYKSAGITILEPAISGALYALTLVVSVLEFWGLSFGWKRLFSTIASMGTAFVVAFISAWIGEVLQAKKGRS